MSPVGALSIASPIQARVACMVEEIFLISPPPRVVEKLLFREDFGVK